MKRCIYLMLMLPGLCFGQGNEFKIHSNGLIYDSATMLRLGIIVDSLNVKFRMCDLSHPYNSFWQGMATSVSIPDKQALKLMRSGITLEEYKKKYPLRGKPKEIWIVKSRYENYEGKKYLEYSSLPASRGEEISINLKDTRTNDKKSGWVIDEDEENALWIEAFQSTELPNEYARLVQYVDCMVDTSTEIFTTSRRGRVYQRVEAESAAGRFVAWAESYPGEPKYPDYKELEKKNLKWDSVYDAYSKKRNTWDSLRILHLDDKMSSSSYWMGMLKEAAEEGAEGNSDARLEFYVGRYLSKSDALALMRARRVVGNCSQDMSPRYHAMNICMLSAETAKWEVFLRSHLDIMNDRFDRMSDGSYAWAGRKTYLKELEALDIHAIDLLIGTSLRVENVNDHHYWGSIGRIGRALADASDKDSLEKRLLEMINNQKLDPYNRLLMAYLFKNYAYSLDDETRKKQADSDLANCVGTWPEFMKSVWKP